MDEQLVNTLTHGALKAEIYSTGRPGEYKVDYRDSDGKTIDEMPLTGISSYKQREDEIVAHLRELAEKGPHTGVHDLGDSGEY